MLAARLFIRTEIRIQCFLLWINCLIHKLDHNPPEISSPFYRFSLIKSVRCRLWTDTIYLSDTSSSGTPDRIEIDLNFLFRLPLGEVTIFPDNVGGIRGFACGTFAGFGISSCCRFTC